MNETHLLTDETSLVARALDGLRASAGLEGEIFPRADRHADASILLQIQGRKLRYPS